MCRCLFLRHQLWKEAIAKEKSLWLMLMTLHLGQRGLDHQQECMSLASSDLMLHFRPMRIAFERLCCWLKEPLTSHLSLDTNIPKWFATKDWNFLLCNLDDAYENLVKEFYANAIVEGEELKCWVRGKRFSVTPVYLAEILHINPPILPIPPVYNELNLGEEVLREALGDSLGFSSNGKSVSEASLSPKLRLLTMIMFSNLYPLSSTEYMNLGRALFLHDLITDEEIVLCSHIFHILAKTIERIALRNCLPFCRLISKILKLKGVHPSDDKHPCPKPSPINICTLHASMSHSKKSTKQEGHATPGSSSSTFHAYNEQLDNIMVALQEINTKISGLATISTPNIHFDIKLTSLQTQLDQIQRKLEEYD